MSKSNVITTIDEQIAFFKAAVKEDYPGRTLDACLRAAMQNIIYSTVEQMAQICDVKRDDATLQYSDPRMAAVARQTAQDCANAIRWSE